MKNRLAKMLFVKPGQLLRITNRQKVRWAPSGLGAGWVAQYYGYDVKPTTKQKRRAKLRGVV